MFCCFLAGVCFYGSIGSVSALKHQVALVQVPTFQNTLTTALMRTPGRPTVGNRGESEEAGRTSLRLPE